MIDNLYRPHYEWYDKVFGFVVLIFIVSTILFMLFGGDYCDITTAAPFC